MGICHCFNEQKNSCSEDNLDIYSIISNADSQRTPFTEQISNNKQHIFKNQFYELNQYEYIKQNISDILQKGKPEKWYVFENLLKEYKQQINEYLDLYINKDILKKQYINNEQLSNHQQFIIEFKGLHLTNLINKNNFQNPYIYFQIHQKDQQQQQQKYFTYKTKEHQSNTKVQQKQQNYSSSNKNSFQEKDFLTPVKNECQETQAPIDDNFSNNSFLKSIPQKMCTPNQKQNNNEENMFLSNNSQIYSQFIEIGQQVKFPLQYLKKPQDKYLESKQQELISSGETLETQQIQKIVFQKSDVFLGIEKQYFTIKLVMFDIQKNKEVQIGTDQTFCLFEIKDQKPHEKQLIIKRSNNATQNNYAVIDIKVQAIYNYPNYLHYWNTELNARISQIDKILKYIKEHPENYLGQNLQGANNHSLQKKEKPVALNNTTQNDIESLISNMSRKQSLDSIKYSQNNKQQEDDNSSFYQSGFYIK